MRKQKNLILGSDSYKLQQPFLRFDNVNGVSAYFASRPGAQYDHTRLMGLQYTIEEYMAGRVVFQEHIDEAKLVLPLHFNKPLEEAFKFRPWQELVDLNGGKLSIRIKAMPEGVAVPVGKGNALFVVENMDPDNLSLDAFRDITNHFETISTWVWGGSLTITKSAVTQKIILKALQESCDYAEDVAPFMLHDFGMRGSSCYEQAAICGAAHILAGGMGTDTLGPTLDMIDGHYEGDFINEPYCFSVRANEHSITTSEGKGKEHLVMAHNIKVSPTGVLSYVSDSYGVVETLTNMICGTFKDAIIKRWEHAPKDSLTKFVVRPDSPRFKGDTAEDQVLWIVETLSETFGYTTNDKGYKVLHPSVGCIYGDGLKDDDIINIYDMLLENKWSAENCLVGQGGNLHLASGNRDSQRSAFKCSAQRKIGEDWHDVYKEPADKSKASMRGRLKNVKIDGVITTVRLEEYPELEDLMVPIFENGVLLKKYSYKEIRHNVATT